MNAIDEVAQGFWRNVLEKLAADVRQGVAMLQEGLQRRNSSKRFRIILASNTNI
ncbi:MAG TPA: hypothetical protein QF695_15595 [Arenicellales bacterium]|nr:hypothetical protein [Arenicellales bacterium]